MLKNVFRESVKKNSFLYALAKLFKNKNNAEFLQMIIDDSCNVRISPAPNNMGKAPVCFLDVVTPAGMFWYLRIVLEFLYFCDNMGFVPQIKWSESLYYDSSIGNASNAFEYYFCQPSIIPDEELESRPIVSYAPGDRFLARKLIGRNCGLYEGNPKYISALAASAKSSLQFNKDVQNHVDKFVNMQGIDFNTLGVHARGTDFRRNIKGHPIYVAIEDFYDYVDEALNTYGYKSIFFSTDDSEMLDCFINHYHDIDIRYADGINRGKGEKGIHVDAALSLSRSPYKEGLDALCDMVALSKCGGLISGVSNLPLVSRVFCLKDGNEFKYDKVINKGINTHGEKVPNSITQLLKS